MSAKRQQAIDDLDDTLGLEDAARMLRLGLEAMKDLVDRGDVPAVRLNQKHTVMLREDLIDFLRAEGRRQAAERKKSAILARPAANTPESLPTRRSSKSRRTKLPDLRAYEQADHQS
ncbi:helix-turn-helix domain-containing protein [Stenotrophomonas maltophilia]|uniref:helix-turn-helix domain-containing protein n=1 Tax=Stenotrophomonas maltophilia TaxID=40324 RepID=UPI0021C97217|nr:helix-turn-helix domain-containing protein [Stenotrophomonas maltophilia]MCU1092691.1 helix-turn-helix domain-containing protein [Stenotrophomonas maltophilia]